LKYRHILEKAILPLGDVMTGSAFMQDLRRLRKEDMLSRAALQNLQMIRLSRLLEYAVHHSAYYKRFRDFQSDDPVRFLKRFPILEKSTLRENIDAIVTKDKKNLIRQNSSGSSGFQTTVYFDKGEQSFQRAQQIRWWEWAGYEIGRPILQTGITPNRGLVKSIKDRLFRTYYLPAFAHTEEEVFRALEWAASQKTTPVLAGYASSLYVLAEIARTHRIDARFKTAISWGDKLFDHYRTSIESLFHTRVHETYASSEGFMIAAQKDLPYMYIMTPDVYLEIVDDEGNEVPDGEMGHVIVTKLNNYSMPMIRYRIGDLAVKLPESEYPESRELNYPLLKRVVGRDTDIIKTRSGKFMVVHSFTGIIEHYPQIRQYTVIQRTLDGIEIQYIPDKEFHPSILHKIENTIRDHLKESDFIITFKRVDYIPASPSGKPQIIQSYLENI